MRARVPQGLRIGLKREGVGATGKQVFVIAFCVGFPLFAPGSVIPQGASSSLQPCRNSRALASSAATNMRGCLPNLQHMHPSWPPPLFLQYLTNPLTHTHTQTHTLCNLTSFLQHPSAEGDIFPQAITTLTCKVCFCLRHQLLYSRPLIFSHLEKKNVENNPPTGQLLPFCSGLQRSCRSALSEVKRSVWGLLCGQHARTKVI